MSLEFYRGKTVFVTGHTGFKGSWMCKVLEMYGANVVGYALEPTTSPNLFSLLNLKIHSIIGDIRDLDHLSTAMKQCSPEIVIHMAAQPIVREGYRDPVYTYQTNVMGTVHVCEAIRQCESVKSFVNVTTDKVYRNNEWPWGYRETDPLDGYDPYSNSKSCSELVTSCYKNSFFDTKKIAVSTCRAGNVIGGGDFAPDRILPDCVRAMKNKEKIFVRNPHSVRPYQHVLEPVAAYLLLAMKQYDDLRLAGNYNIGPKERDCISTGELVDLFCRIWGDAQWEMVSIDDAPHEANFLKLDSSKIRSVIGWKPCWNMEESVQKTVVWSQEYLAEKDVNAVTERQIREYFSRCG